MAQYFDNVELKNPKTYSYNAVIGDKSYSLLGTSGTFSKDGLDDGSKLLLETIFQAHLGKTILDLGCGSGPLGLILAATDSTREITLADVNLRALDMANTNAKNLGVTSQVKIVTSDVYLNIHSVFDTIVINPPIRAGKKVTYAMYEGAPSHLEKDGCLYIVIRRKQGADSAQAYISTLFNKVEVIASKKGYRVIKATK